MCIVMEIFARIVVHGRICYFIVHRFLSSCIVVLLAIACKSVISKSKRPSKSSSKKLPTFLYDVIVHSHSHYVVLLGVIKNIVCYKITAPITRTTSYYYATIETNHV